MSQDEAPRGLMMSLAGPRLPQPVLEKLQNLRHDPERAAFFLATRLNAMDWTWEPLQEVEAYIQVLEDAPEALLPSSIHAEILQAARDFFMARDRAIIHLEGVPVDLQRVLARTQDVADARLGRKLVRSKATEATVTAVPQLGLPLGPSAHPDQLDELGQWQTSDLGKALFRHNRFLPLAVRRLDWPEYARRIDEEIGPQWKGEVETGAFITTFTEASFLTWSDSLGRRFGRQGWQQTMQAITAREADANHPRGFARVKQMAHVALDAGPSGG